MYGILLLAMVSTREIKRSEVYWAKLDPAVGSEIQQTRPWIVVSPDILNNLLNTILVVLLTKMFIDWPFRLTIALKNQESSAACDHLRSI